MFREAEVFISCILVAFIYLIGVKLMLIDKKALLSVVNVGKVCIL